MVGRPRLTVGGEERVISSAKQILLLARLARSTNHAASREQLAAFLWPGHPPANARTSLRQALTRLRGTIDAPNDPFDAEANRVALAGHRWASDLDDVNSVIDQTASLVFLDGIEVDEPEIQDWLETERRIVASEIERVMMQRLSLQRGPDEIPLVLRLVALDPFNEDAHRHLMELYAETGQRARALAVFETFRKRLDEKLGEVPMAETRHLAASIRRANGMRDQSQPPRTEATGPGTAEEVSPIGFRPMAAPGRTGRNLLPRTLTVLAVGITAVLLAALFAQRDPIATTPSEQAVAAHGPSVPAALGVNVALEKPSIAVLAFENLTGDPEQVHVSDGLSEDIITTLARLPGVAVVARNSSFTYKGNPVDVRRIAEELGVQYVLEGSLQSFDTKLRVTAQLIDARSGHHLWSRSFDRPRVEFFDVRDEITFAIIAELNSALLEGDAYWANRDAFRSIDTWLLGRKAIRHIYRFTRSDNQVAIDLLHEILQAEPESAWAHGLLAYRHAWNFRASWSDDPEESVRLAEAHGSEAIALNPRHPAGYSGLAFVRNSQGRFEEAIALSEQALERAPGDAEEMALLAVYLQKDMQADRSVRLFERAARMNRKAPGWFWKAYGESLRFAGRYEEAVPIYADALKRGVSGIMRAETHLGLAVSYDQLGLPGQARDEIAAGIEALPELSVAFLRKAYAYKDQNAKERWLATLRRLGLPDE